MNKMILLISTVVCIIAFILNIFEFGLVDKFVAEYGSWGHILGAGLIWLLSLILFLAVIIFNIIAYASKKTD